MTVSGAISRFIYADDSGYLDKGWIVFGWLELSASDWDRVLAHWLAFRKKLVADYSVPVVQEIHTTHVVYGRSKDSISTNPPERIRAGNREWKAALGREVLVRCLQAIRDCPDIEVGVAYFRTNKRGREISEDRELAYTRLVAMWDQQLRHQDDYGIVGMDGDGTDPIYYKAHRALDDLFNRRVIEDPMFHSSQRSQWTQMADVIAWSGFTHLWKHDSNEFAWNWYDDYLRPKNPMSDPIDLSTLP